MSFWDFGHSKEDRQEKKAVRLTGHYGPVRSHRFLEEQSAPVCPLSYSPSLCFSLVNMSFSVGSKFFFCYVEK